MLSLATFTWTTVSVDSSSIPPGYSEKGLNLIGHSVVPSPLDKDEIYIFGGRRNDEKGYGVPRKEEHVPANLLSLHLGTMKLSIVAVSSPNNDIKSFPEARVNHICLSLLSRTVQFADEKTEEKPPVRKGKAARRAPVIPEKRPPLVPHPVLRVYGGSKLYSPGFCTGTIYDLYFIPAEKKDMLSRMESSTRRTEDDRSQQGNVDFRYPSTRKMSSIEIAIAQQNESGTGEMFHMLNLKPDSQMRLLSPTRGVSGRYFQLKTSLSRSRSTFSRPGTRPLSPQLPEVHLGAGRPVSAPIGVSLSMASVDNSLGDTASDKDSVKSGLPPAQAVMSKRALARMEREHYRQMGMALSPLTKGMTYVDARAVFNELYPPLLNRTGLETRPFSSSATI